MEGKSSLTKSAISVNILPHCKYRVLKVSVPNLTVPPPPELAEILKRLFYLKSRFHVGLPETMTAFKKTLDESNWRDKADGLNRFDLLYTIGIIFSRQSEPITMGELSRTLDVPLSTATRIMDWLVKNEYAQRLADPDDRRVVRVQLTAAGQEMYQTINAFLLERVERLMRPFTARERKDLSVLLCKLMDALEEERTAG
jgi:DNA-binding MarR family transcriptional regulator